MILKTLLLLFIFGLVSSSKILVWPLNLGASSRVSNMIKMAEIMQDDGYNVTLLTSNLLEPLVDEARIVDKMVYQIPTDKKDAILSGGGFEDMTTLLGIKRYFERWSTNHYDSCEAVFLNRSTSIESILRASKFDLILYDIDEHCAALFRDSLSIPGFQWSDYGSVFYTDVFFPELPSYVCSSDSLTCDVKSMNFMERFWNLVFFSWTRLAYIFFQMLLHDLNNFGKIYIYIKQQAV